MTLFREVKPGLFAITCLPRLNCPECHERTLEPLVAPFNREDLRTINWLRCTKNPKDHLYFAENREIAIERTRLANFIMSTMLGISFSELIQQMRNPQ